MIPFMFAQMVAQCIDRKTGLVIASDIVKGRREALSATVEDRQIGKAASETIKRTVPLSADKLAPRVQVNSTRAVAGLLVEIVRLQTGELAIDKRLWEESSRLQEVLRRTFRIFLDELSGTVREEDRDKDKLEALRTVIIGVIQGADAHLKEVQLRWGSLMTEPQFLLLVAAELEASPPDQQNQLFVEIVSRLTGLETKPSLKMFAEQLRQIQLIVKLPAGQA